MLTCRDLGLHHTESVLGIKQLVFRCKEVVLRSTVGVELHTVGVESLRVDC